MRLRFGLMLTGCAFRNGRFRRKPLQSVSAGGWLFIAWDRMARREGWEAQAGC